MGRKNIKIGIIGGSGLDDPANHVILQSPTEIKREDAKNDFGLPSSNLYLGTIAGVDVVLLSRHGIGHKLSASSINYRANIEALRLIGCTHVLSYTACGSLLESIGKEQLVIPDSFIDRTVHRKGTFYDGSSQHYKEVAYTPMEPAFDPQTSRILEAAAKKLQIPITIGGTIVTIDGPRFSSKAESKMYRQWGGHLINMTTYPEVCLAKEAGLFYATLAIITDYDCWKEGENVCPTAIIAILKRNTSTIIKLFVEAIQLINKEEWDEQIEKIKSTIQTTMMSSSS